MRINQVLKKIKTSPTLKNMTSTVKIINPEELREWMTDKSLKPGKDFVVVDVRDEDRIGGHILHSVNVPAHEIRDRAHYLIEQNKEIPKVIFHCALSQVRGPKSARIYNEELVRTGGAANQQVYVLRGGFTEFQKLYRDEPELVEAFDKDLWSME